jgi:hypothetical protein
MVDWEILIPLAWGRIVSALLTFIFFAGTGLLDGPAYDNRRGNLVKEL